MHSNIIKTVLGSVDSHNLGFCHSHEHIFIEPRIPKDCPVSPMNDYQLSLKELKSFYEAGGRTIVDCQPVSAGGNIEILKSLSRDSGVNIIGSTGFHRHFFYDEATSLEDKSAEELIKLFSSEINEGAGVIKTAVEAVGISEKDYKMHKAAALTSRNSGVPVIIHVEKNCSLIDIINFYKQYSVEPERLILCHGDRMIENLEEHLMALKLGAYLEYDTIGRFKYHDNGKEISIIKYILEQGFGKQLLLSLDSTKQRLESYGGNVGLTYMIREFIPHMRKEGISDSAIKDMTVNNPAKAFSYKN